MLGVGAREIKLLVLVVVMVMLFGVALSIAAGRGLLKIPTFDVFQVISTLAESLQEQLWIAGHTARDWFCSRDIQELREVCTITSQQLEAECDKTPADREAYCKDPQVPDTMNGWCGLPAKDKEGICRGGEKQFLAGCENLYLQFALWEGKVSKPSTADLPFCK